MAHFKKYSLFLAAMLLVGNPSVKAQAFSKGAILVSISEGTTTAHYTTNNTAVGDGKLSDNNTGNRDPLTIEYGLTRHWGIGLNLGTDIYKVSPSQFYGFTPVADKVNAFVSEVTLDGNYHFFDSRHTDLAAVASYGICSVMINGKNGDSPYQYASKGAIIRAGAKLKYYFRHRFGVLAMASVFSTSTSTTGMHGNSFGESYTTGLTGCALEFGLCYRFF